jgi:hypothetical protein
MLEIPETPTRYRHDLKTDMKDLIQAVSASDRTSLTSKGDGKRGLSQLAVLDIAVGLAVNQNLTLTILTGTIVTGATKTQLISKDSPLNTRGKHGFRWYILNLQLMKNRNGIIRIGPTDEREQIVGITAASRVGSLNAQSRVLGAAEEVVCVVAGELEGDVCHGAEGGAGDGEVGDCHVFVAGAGVGWRCGEGSGCTEDGGCEEGGEVHGGLGWWFWGGGEDWYVG